jgi:hypothetical protein
LGLPAFLLVLELEKPGRSHIGLPTAFQKAITQQIEFWRSPIPIERPENYDLA